VRLSDTSETRRRGKRERGEEQASASRRQRRRSLPPSADRRRRALRLPPPLRARDAGGEGGMGLGLQGATTAAGFVRPKSVVGRPIQITADRRPAAADGSRARFGPDGHGAWPVSAARPLAAGLRAQVAVWRPTAGCFHL
jgi:hypothetical protein